MNVPAAAPTLRISAGFKASVPVAGAKMGTRDEATRIDRIVALDLETTGLDPRGDRIVEFALILLDHDLDEIDRWNELVHPGCAIPEQATNVHGITDDDVRDAPPFKEVAPVVQTLLDDAVLMAYNHEFDLEFLDAELKRAGGPGIQPRSPTIDPMLHFREHHPDTSNRLEHAVQHYLDEPLDGAHRALHDTEAMVEVFRAMRRVHPALSQDLASAIVEPRDWVDEEKKLYADEDGTVRFGFGKHEGKPVRAHASYAEWMLDGDFPEETKARLREILARSTAKRA